MTIPAEVVAELECVFRKNEWQIGLAALRDAVDNLHRYTIVDRSVVEYSPAVEAAVRVFSSDQGISAPELRFFLPESVAERAYVRRYGHRDWESFGYSSGLKGLCVQGAGLPSTVFVRADLADVWDAVAVTAHEVRHAAQSRDLTNLPAEVDAEDYARRQTGRDAAQARVKKERNR